MTREAIILASDLETRPRGVPRSTSFKSVAPIFGILFFGLLLQSLAKKSLNQTVSLVKHKAGLIRLYFNSWLRRVPMAYRLEISPYDTGETTRLVIAQDPIDRILFFI